MITRGLILTISLLPFLYYAYKDHLFHFRGRKVTLAEHLLHLAIGLLLFAALGNAYLGNSWIMLSILVVFMLAGSIDEYIFHRALPGEESDLHAKEHLSLLLFIIVMMLTDWFQAHDWNFAEVWQQLRDQYHHYHK